MDNGSEKLTENKNNNHKYLFLFHEEKFFFREIKTTWNGYPREIFANAIFHDTPKTEGNIGFVWNPASPNS